MENENMEINNDVIENDEDVEMGTEVSTKTGSNTTLIIGASLLAGGLLAKFVVNPVCGKVKSAWENRKFLKHHEADDEDVVDVETVEVEDEN